MKTPRTLAFSFTQLANNFGSVAARSDVHLPVETQFKQLKQNVDKIERKLIKAAHAENMEKVSMLAQLLVNQRAKLQILADSISRRSVETKRDRMTGEVLSSVSIKALERPKVSNDRVVSPVPNPKDFHRTGRRHGSVDYLPGTLNAKGQLVRPRAPKAKPTLGAAPIGTEQASIARIVRKAAIAALPVLPGEQEPRSKPVPKPTVLKRKGRGRPVKTGITVTIGKSEPMTAGTMQPDTEARRQAERRLLVRHEDRHLFDRAAEELAKEGKASLHTPKPKA